MDRKIKIFSFAGSLRKGSYNKALLNAAVELAPENTEIEVFDLEGIPLYNQDLEKQPSHIVIEFKEKIKAADALLIVTPEYNYSMTGVIKNALDVASRPPADRIFDGKPVAIMSASPGRFGGARAQYQLRQTLIFLNAHPVNRPEIMLSQADKSIDENGKINNEDTRRLIKQLLDELVSWTKKIEGK
jgi:chromate reductase, NAD(P)H dehydrogenase (quinone)